MTTKQVCLDYGRDRASVRYAAALAHRLGVLLAVHYAPPARCRISEAVADETQKRIGHEMLAGLREFPGLDIDVFAAEHGPVVWPTTDALIVSNTLERHPALPVLRPAHARVPSSGSAPVFIPFGNKPELERGYVWGLQFAALLHTRAIAWHATYRRDGVKSADPRDHWHDGARVVAAQAEEYAKRTGVDLEIIIETPPNIVLSMHSAALAAGAECIVVQKDQGVIAGGYDYQLIKKILHEVPLVVLPERRSA